MAKAKSKLQEMVANATTNALEVAATELSTSKKVNKTKEVTEQPKGVKTKKETKKAKVVKSVVREQNTAIVEEVVSKREVKYLYPENIAKDPNEKKRWRQSVRNELRRLEREMNRIEDQNSKEYKAAKKAFENYQKEVLKPGQIA